MSEQSLPSPGVEQAPAEEFLRLALGANHFSSQLPALLISGAILLAIAATAWKRRRNKL